MTEYDIDFTRIGKFLTRCTINLILPFINGMMMGFGEIFAHELCFRYSWQFARVVPSNRKVSTGIHSSSILNRA